MQGFTSDVIHPTDKMSTKARDAAWNADLATELDNLAASVASATLSNKSGIGNSLASPIPRDGTDGSDGLGTFEALGPPESPRSRPTDQDQEPWGRH